MSETLTIELAPDTVEQLRRAAAAQGEGVEVLASRLLADAAACLDARDTALSQEQLADLEERLKNPGPFASDAEVEAFFARFQA